MFKLFGFVVLSLLTIEAFSANEECLPLDKVQDILTPYAGKEDGNIEMFGKTTSPGEWGILYFTGTLPSPISIDGIEMMSEASQSPGTLLLKKSTPDSPKPPKPYPLNVRNFLYQKKGPICCYYLSKTKNFVYLAKRKK